MRLKINRVQRSGERPEDINQVDGDRTALRMCRDHLKIDCNYNLQFLLNKRTA